MVCYDIIILIWTHVHFCKLQTWKFVWFIAIADHMRQRIYETVEAPTIIGSHTMLHSIMNDMDKTWLRSMTLFCGTDNIPRNILDIQLER